VDFINFIRVICISCVDVMEFLNLQLHDINLFEQFAGTGNRKSAPCRIPQYQHIPFCLYMLLLNELYEPESAEL